MQKLLLIWLTLFVCVAAQARQVRIYGYITDSDNRGIEFVNAYSGTGSELVGTSSNRNGYYELLLSEQDTVTLTFSMIGYTTVIQRVIAPREVVNINVTMATDEQWLEEVEVRGLKRTTGTMDEIDATTTRVMPDATGGSIESILITFAGVNQNNELSSQYNVRGGSFDENVVYVNGIEVHRPLLIRSGQQEGLSFVNPNMVENVSFSAGGFDAQYGDKMSSVLDITYKTPTRFEASLMASLLGVSAYVGHGSERFSQMHGIRYKTGSYMLGGLNTTGNYRPNYVDYQTQMTWKPLSRPSGTLSPTGARGYADSWTMSFLGNVSQNTYAFRPDSMSESWGGMDAKNLSIWYEGQERDRFITAFAALSARGHVRQDVEIGFDLSGFYTNEQENYDITGEYILSNAPMDGSGPSNSGSSGHTGSSDRVDNPSPSDALGTGIFHQHARNILRAGVITLAHSGNWTRDENRLEWGISARAELIGDRIAEWERRDSAGYSMPYNDKARLYYSMRGETEMRSARVQGYLQNTHRWNTRSGQWILTVGGRLQYWTFTHEVLPSPRASVTWNPGWKRDVQLRLATGLYYQAPFYKELRDTLTDGQGVTRIRLNDRLRAQRSYQTVLGADYYFRAWGRPFKLTAEAYGKYIDRLESYSVENVRVRYAGVIDGKGYAVGLDLKLYGELVPGADSWISFSTMRSRMLLNDYPELGWMPSPQEQRYSFTMFFQDYVPQLPQLKFHLKFIWSDGMPFSAPRNIASQRVLRMPDYRRIDLGATYIFDRKTARFMRAASARHIDNWTIGFEVFNLVDWRNVNSYFWVSDAYGQNWASPNYLTGRRYNLKLTVDLR